MEIFNNKGYIKNNSFNIWDNYKNFLYKNLSPLSKDTVSFKSNAAAKSNNTSLSDDEFKKLQEDIKSLIDRMPMWEEEKKQDPDYADEIDKAKEIFKKWDFSKTNIYLAYKIISTSGLLALDDLERVILVLNSSDTVEKSEIKEAMLDRIISDDCKKETFITIPTPITPPGIKPIEKVQRPVNLVPYFLDTVAAADTPEQKAVFDALMDSKYVKNGIKSGFYRLSNIINNCTSKNQADVFIEKVIPKLNENNENLWAVSHDIMKGLGNELQKDLVLKSLDICSDCDYSQVINIYSLIQSVSNDTHKDFVNKVLSDKKYYQNDTLMQSILKTTENSNLGNEISQVLIKLIDNEILISEHPEDIYPIIKLSKSLIFSYQKDDLDLISPEDKRSFLKTIISADECMFKYADSLKEMFPLIPISAEEYSLLIKNLVSSMGIKTEHFTQQQTEKFDIELSKLTKLLNELSEENFDSVEIEQTYSINEFASDVFEKINDLSSDEKQSIFSCFGFVINESKDDDKIEYYISGYPSNINVERILEKVKDKKLKNIIESISNDVERFCCNNSVISNNPEIGASVNEILNLLPELRTSVNKYQMENIFSSSEAMINYKFDSFKHSLKTMFKIIKSPEYNDLNNSDKRLMLLTALFHDITRSEGKIDNNHAETGSFDAYFISKKLNLSKEEEIKLYTLIKNHEWLYFVNSSQDKNETDNRLKSCSYDLRHDNILDMCKIFSNADIEATMQNNLNIDNNTNIQREIESLIEYCNHYYETMKNNIDELKKTQPLLPVTKLPKASKINSAIKTVYSDGSTNIKGIYRDKDGLIVIKFNEIQNDDNSWEIIGFNKGCKSRGIKTITDINEKVDTGNIKFFVHGLDTQMQLARFNAFSSIDSDALLSVSYAERPECKYRFFRPQGIILDADTKYIHGGGKTDRGSGYKKNIDTFKSEYIFGGNRETDRTYISDLIKETLKMDDKTYVDFVQKNQNKSISEIEPMEIREMLIKAYASINSNQRKGYREYNEMYISNPKPPMGVFAYNIVPGESIGNPIEFLNRTNLEPEEQKITSLSVKERTNFIRKYAIDNDLPFIVFGN